MNPTEFFPRGDRVLVQVVEAPKASSSIIISVSQQNERTVMAVVLDIGPDVNAVKGASAIVDSAPTERDDPIIVGDTVIFCREHGIPVKFDGQELVFVRQEHIMASTEGGL